MSFINQTHYNVICGRDFNIDMFSGSTSSREMDSISMNGCINTTADRTRVTLHSTTLLDLFITNIHVNRVKVGVISGDLSNHLPIFFSVCTTMSKNTIKHQPMIVQYLNITSLAAFSRDVETENWDIVIMQSTADGAYNVFLELMLESYRHHFPNKSIKMTKKDLKAVSNQRNHK